MAAASMSQSLLNLEDLKALTEDLSATVNSLSVEAGGTGGNASERQLRQKIVSSATSILAIAKDPAGMGMEAIGQVTVITANRIFWEWGVFDNIPFEDGGSASYEDLATKAKADVSLIARMAAVLISAGVLKQIGKDCIGHTPRSRIFVKVKDQMAGYTYQMAWENAIASYSQLPQYFQTYGRKEPQSQNHVPISFAAGMPELTYYELLTRDSARRQTFMKAMAPLEESMPITGIYDFGWAVVRIGKEDPDRLLFVDIGGGDGHALLAIQKENPVIPLNRCMLQDLPEVIKAVEASGSPPELREVQKAAIDFNKDQPVKGALIYWIRRCLHNHSDSASVNILRHVADAMDVDSKLLIQEDILDDSPNPLASVVDMLMMCFGGKQRTIDCWEQITTEAGLRISGVSKGTRSSLGVIECVKHVGQLKSG